MSNFSKKLSLIVALCVMVTIGGVYATWTYSENAVNTIADYMTGNMQSYTGASAAGHIEVLEKTVDIRVTDNMDGTTDVGANKGDYIAELNADGHIIVLFTPFTQASDDVKANGISLTFALGVTGSAQYDNTDIFTVNTNAQDCVAMTKITAANIDDLNSHYASQNHLTEDDYGKFIVEIKAEDFITEGLIALGGEFELETLAKYHEFQEQLGNVNFTITINQK